ncbi:matrixin family metalloprotease [Rhodohalobacter sp.]|uniref:matrixin family metalloprotease n=1 Tax=Rhodohalobacter sp. TaxID=1974210 RepID=UPI002ACEFD45|nr:matrixin family metalloprotease [Rhodohalobacter sp.]MDZ7755014.1 matrixin family metalloprotease [Rhodohalobacter sp.]
MTLVDLLKYAIIVLVVVVAGWFFFSYEKPERVMHSDLGACDEPLSYRIGTIDPRFDISEEEVKDAMQVASTLWSEAINRPLAYYAEDGEIAIDFIYDDRQELAVGEMRFREQIESEQIRTDQLQREYEVRRARFEQKSSEYEQLANQTKREIDELNKWAQGKNGTLDLTEQERRYFEQKKKDVERMQERLLYEKSVLDQLAHEINNYVDRLNNRIEESNTLIDQYNEDYAGESRFTKATYRNLNVGGVITVNQFLNKRDLYLVLAHELGHALGLKHGDDPKSIMYSQMGGQEIYPIIQLTTEDKRAIAEVCK